MPTLQVCGTCRYYLCSDCTYVLDRPSDTDILSCLRDIGTLTPESYSVLVRKLSDCEQPVHFRILTNRLSGWHYTCIKGCRGGDPITSNDGTIAIDGTLCHSYIYEKDPLDRCPHYNPDPVQATASTNSYVRFSELPTTCIGSAFRKLCSTLTNSCAEFATFVESDEIRGIRDRLFVCGGALRTIAENHYWDEEYRPPRDIDIFCSDNESFNIAFRTLEAICGRCTLKSEFAYTWGNAEIPIQLVHRMFRRHVTDILRLFDFHCCMIGTDLNFETVSHSTRALTDVKDRILRYNPSTNPGISFLRAMKFARLGYRFTSESLLCLLNEAVYSAATGNISNLLQNASDLNLLCRAR